MGLLNLASNASAWRGYEYYTEEKVLNQKRISEHEFCGTVVGSENQQYDVLINIEHPRRSHCNCPHADGKRIVCKHQVALYFSVFPDEAKRYYDLICQNEEEEKRLQDELEQKIEKCINGMTKEELRQTLYEVFYDGPDWVLDRFVRDHIDF